MIILSGLTFVFMLVWGVASAGMLALTLACLSDSKDASCFLWLCVSAFSLLCWFQAVAWGEPWFRLCIQAWM